MITPTLEKELVLGHARSKTFVAGGGQKSAIKVGKDKTVVIHSFTFFPFIPIVQPQSNPFSAQIFNTIQMRIFSSKSNNHFVIRQDIRVTPDQDGINYWFFPGQPYQENTWLVHDTDIGINFSNAPLINPTVVAVGPPEMPALPVPLDYGKQGQTGGLGAPIPIIRAGQVGLAGEYRPIGNFQRATPGANSFNQLAFPIDALTALGASGLEQSPVSFPICIINYVEIDTNKTNLQLSTN